MDKRTILFVISLTLTLFLVNLYFDQQNGQNVQKWKEQQAVNNKENQLKLKSEIEQKTAHVDELPLYYLYKDADGKELLAIGVKSNQSYLTLSWDAKVPTQVFAIPAKLASENSESHKQETIKLLLATQVKTEEIQRGIPIVYSEDGSDSKLAVAPLTEFGKYTLQILETTKKSGEVFPSVYLGKYTDGRFEIPAEELFALEKNSVNTDDEKITHSSPSNSYPTIPKAIVLFKAGNTYLPTAIYNGDLKTLEPLDSVPTLKGTTSKPKESQGSEGALQSEKFYVLETPYQQLVFSNVGGALVEINLPFKSNVDEKSAVREIEFDRDLVQNNPQNSYFPAHPYFTYPENGNVENVVEHAKGSLGGYYPLLRRDLIEKDRKLSVRVKPKYYALNIVSEYPETAELNFTLKSFDKDSIVFEGMQGYRKITKTYSVAKESEAPYAIDVVIDVEGDSRGLWLTSGVPEVELISGSPAPSLKYRITRNTQAVVESIDLPKDLTTVTSSYIDWVCNSNGFLGVIMDPLTDTDSGYRVQLIPGTAVPSRLVEIDKQHERFKAEDLPGYMALLPLKSQGGIMHYRIFAGPFATDVLNTVDKTYTNEATGYNPDYIACQTFHGWFAFISEPFAKFLFVLMNFFHTYTDSWAFSIILLTIALRIMLYPLNAWSTKSMLKMQQIAPDVTAIQERYKKDPKKAQVEIMNLYREKGVNPVTGCFPLLIQMPFLIGMFDLLKSTFELRGASFIPGWIDNLTSPDVLFSWNFHIPLIGNQFHLLPILLGGVMFLQQRMMSTLPKDQSLWTEQQKQQRFMGTIMAVVFTVMFYNFPSGLNIYWLSSMLLGILQQWWTSVQMKKGAKNVEVLPQNPKKKTLAK